MLFYRWHIGDFRKSTRGLTFTERGVYREMLDEYYETEQPLPLEEEKLFDALGVRTTSEQCLVRKVLHRKWLKTDQGYVQARALAELLNQKEKSTTKAAIGKLGGLAKHKRLLDAKLADARKSLANGTLSLALLVNHEPVTSNQEPITTNQPRLPAAADVCLSVPEWAVLIRAAYGRQDSPEECERLIVVELQKGTVPAEMLAKVQACMAAIEKHAPGGIENPYAPQALTFFSGQKWTDPAIFERRWADREKKEGAPGLGDGMSDGITDIPEPDAWREAWPELYDFPAPSTWRDVPEAGQRDLLQWLPTREKRKGAA